MDNKPNILEDILDIFKNDKEHHVYFHIEPYVFKVYIEYDYDCKFEGDMVIPVVYDSTEEIVCISDKEYKDMYTDKQYGIDIYEIRLISKVMEYIEKNKVYINTLCERCCWDNRKEDKTEGNIL